MDGAASVRRNDDDKQDVKPLVAKTLNRVPRACNACRKQKMRCEGADNPPCRRCRNTGLDCLFEKPSREATLTGEAGLERIRSLEAHVAEIRNTQATISNTLTDLVAHLRGSAIHTRSPSTYTPSFNKSPSMGSPSTSTPTISHPSVSEAQSSPPNAQFRNLHGSGMQLPMTRASTGPSNHLTPPTIHHPLRVQSNYGNYRPAGQVFINNSSVPTLPPFSSIRAMGPITALQSHISSPRYQNVDGHPLKPSISPVHATNRSKRQAPPPNVITSAESSDFDDEDHEGLPAHGLVAPWEVLRGLADVAIERAAQETGDGSDSRAQSPLPVRRKRRRLNHGVPRSMVFSDVVTKNIISEAEARELFNMFYDGCSTFLPVFDSSTDTYDSLHERSPFTVDCICMVAARVRDAGGKPSETYLKCLEEVQAMSCATLFVPVMRCEAVQSMILVSGWSDNGWLSGGHAVRMAMELSMHKAWPELLRRMKDNKPDVNEDRDLVIASRTWFCLYLFEHQLSYGTGRPAVLKDDESIEYCRNLLRHPLAIEDDMRLVSTVELIAIRERVHNALAPLEGPVRQGDFEILRRADKEFRNWYTTWDRAFSQKYEDAAFYRQSLQIQHLHAELFHNATALRGIKGPEDVHMMPTPQKELAIRSIDIARKGLDITVHSPAYREGMKYAVHYTHATATFAASFLLRLARLFPNDCDIVEIQNEVEKLAVLMAEIPGKRYALTLQVMLRRSRKRKATMNGQRDRSSGVSNTHSPSIPSSRFEFSPPFQPHYTVNNQLLGMAIPGGTTVHHQHVAHPMYPSLTEVENIWRGFAATSSEQLPVWISDQSLGGTSFSENGMDAFLLPSDYLPPAPQIW